MATATRPLNVCPTNVKEALEWLAALGADGSGATACERVIQQILGSQNGHTLGGVCQTLCQKATEFMTAIKQGNGYASTYQTGGWNNLCQPQGRQCCATTGRGPGCRECTSSGHCTGCCPQCPQQICARIFCLIVPVVHSALWYLYSMLHQNGVRGSNDSNSIQAYLGALGFNKGGLSLTADLVRQALQQQQQQSSGPLTKLISALGTATVQINTALQYSNNIFVDGQSTGGRSTSHSGNNLTTPTSAKDLMLWTIFLPYCSNYGSVYQRLHGTGLAQNGGAQSGPHGALSPHSSPLEDLISGLHVLFIGMEAGGPGQGHASPPHSSPTHQPPSTLFEGINMVCQGMAPYEYYTNGRSGGYSGYDGPTQCLKLLVAGIPIISWAVDMLQGQYGGGGHQYPNANNLEQHLGFDNSGMQWLSSTLGPQFSGHVRSMVQQIKTAYASNGFNGYSSYSYGSVPSTGPTTPRTFREMLLWLQGLPCSEGYHEVRTLLSANSGSGRSTTHSNTPMDPLVNIIFNLPYLFYSLEGMNTAGDRPSGTHSNVAMTRYITDLFESQGIQVNSTATSPRARTPSNINVFSYEQGTIQKTFCAIVAVVYYVVDHLKRKCQPGGQWSNLYVTTDSGLVEFLGWEQNKISGWMTSYGSTILHSVLQYCFGNGSVAAHSRGTNGNHLSDLFQKVSKSIQQGSKSVSSTAPTTFRDTLLCLVGAPLTQGYDSVNKAVPSKTPSHSSNTVQDHITDTIVGVLQLFHKLEGSILSAVLGVFQNGTSVSLRYNYSVKGSTSGSSTDHLGHSIFGASVVMRSVFGFLQQRCNGVVALGTPGESWKDCTVTCNNGQTTGTTTQCKDNNNHLCKFLCLLGWNHEKRGGAGAAPSGTTTLTGTTFHKLLVSWFGDVTAQGTATGYEVYSYGTSNGNEPVLEKLYQCAVQWFQKKTGGEAGKGADSSGTPTTTPTIKEMMLWLIGLPLHSVYKALTGNGSSGVINKKWESLKSRSSAATIGTYSFSTTQLTSSSQITNAILSSSQGMIITMLAIEGSIKSVWEFLTKGLKNENRAFNYGTGSGSGSDSSGKDSSAEACFSLLVDYTYKVHFQLRFLLVMCETEKDNGGWKDCEYRGSASGVSGGGSSGAGSSLECKCNGQSSPTSCPMPLYNFLNGGLNSFKNTLNGNGTSDAEKNGNDARMGFSYNTPTTTTSTTSNGKLTGADIHALLKYYVDTVTGYTSTASIASTQPFSLLAQYIVAIGQRKPSTLGDCFELLWQLGNGELRGYVNEKLKKELKDITSELTGDNRNNGQNNAVTALITAIQNIIPNSHSDHNNDRSLMSLMCDKDTKNTSGTNGCAPYMKSLSSGLYSFYLPSITGSSGSFPFLQYLYDMLRKLLDGMKELKKEFDKCECCTSGSQTCKGLISCPNAHPILYKFGFVFGKPGTLKSNNKKCDTLKTQLGVVLSCTQSAPSTLFKAFECVIQVTYKVLLDRAKGCVTTASGKWNGTVKTSTEELKKAFTLYVENAMYQSYPALICTFACKVFDGNHTCNGDACKERFKDKIQQPTTIIPAPNSSSTPVSSSAVTSITAVIPQYTAPVIDPYHYRTFQKGTKTGTDGTSTSYSFKDALDFHISGANCIRPTPVALRSVIDWILRITTGATDKDKSKDENKHIQELCGAIKEVFKESGVTVNDVNAHVVSLVSGLRKFMGYQDKSESVKGKVGEALGTNGNGVKGALKDKIDKLNGFIGQGGKDNFGSELGKALLKGRYEVNKIGAARHVIGLLTAVVDTITGYKEPEKYVTFAEVVKIFSEILKSTHEGCNELNCNSIGSASASQGDDQNDGLQILKNLFTDLKTFAQKWNSIGQDNGHGILQKQKGLAASKLSQKCNGTQGSSSSNDQYFTKLYEALEKLGQCAEKIKELNNNGNGVTDSKAYRQKITELIDGLKKFGDTIKDCNFSGSEDSNNRSDPQYAVKGAEKLIEETKRGVGRYITTSIYTELVNSYSTISSRLMIESQIASVINRVNQFMEMHRYHLYDLKQLCQWLYRMGQLYANGLKGFVESLISHLEHIIEVIKWIEKLHKHLEVLNASTEAFSMVGAQHAIPAKNIICKLLSSYALSTPSDVSISNDKASEYRGFLSDLRLLALDRYTLQVWQDECNPKDSRPSAIKDWITFENGIIRHSDLNAIREALHTLTGITYNNASHPAPATTPRNRIHDFHAICVIQKFSYQEPIARLERSLKELNKIKDKLEGVKEKCDGGTDVSNDTEITSFCTLVSQFLAEPYGIFSFAKFVHTIMGPNIFSAVIGALEELKNKDQYNKNGDGNLDKIKGILAVMTEGLQSDKDNKDHYKLENICEKLQEFIATLRREYIFCYPVVTATATNAIVPHPDPQSKTSTCDNRGHSKASICKHCYHYLARIFIGSIPNLYRHCRLLYEMCTWKTDSDPVTASWHIDPLRYSHNGTHTVDHRILSFAGYVKAQGWTPKLERGNEEAFYDTAFSFTGHNLFGALKSMVAGNDALDTTTTTDSLKPLDQLFKAVMQHFRKLRDELRKQREKALEDEFNKNPNNKGIPFQAPLPALPSTVRQVLFWLHEMDCNKTFYDQMSQHIKNLCGKSRIDISQETILHVLKLSITQCLEVLATIEDPGRQNADYYYELYTEEHYYAYPDGNIPLFFYTFVEKLMGAFLELNFVCVQCEFRATEGGWSECHIGKAKSGAVKEVFLSHRCICSVDYVKPSALIPANTGANPDYCPRPLYSFLFDNKTDLRIPGDVSHRLPYMSKGTMTCGFQLKNKAITDAATKGDAHTPPTPLPTSVSGSVLIEPLRKLVGGHVTGRLGSTTTRNGINTLSTVIYLRDLLR